MTPFEQTFPIRYGEVDRNSKLRPDVYFQYMQEVAAEHAAKLGFGMKDLYGKGYIWVLSRLFLKVRRTPLLGEHVHLETWPSGIDRLFALREFRMTEASSGELLAEASSCWLVLNGETYRPQRPGPVLPGIFPEDTSSVFFPNLGKLPVAECVHPQTFPVRESGIDVNCHLNNARAVSVLYDWLAEETGPAPEIAEIQVNFDGASRTGELLETSGVIQEKSFAVQTVSGGTMRLQAKGLLR